MDNSSAPLWPAFSTIISSTSNSKQTFKISDYQRRINKAWVTFALLSLWEENRKLTKKDPRASRNNVVFGLNSVNFRSVQLLRHMQRQLQRHLNFVHKMSGSEVQDPGYLLLILNLLERLFTFFSIIEYFFIKFQTSIILAQK